jgi:hypothetical protein
VRWVWLLPGTLLGAGVGVAALLVHRQALWVDGRPLPWGAVLAVAAPAALGLALRGRTPVLLGFLLGWLAVVLGALVEGPGGDFLLMSDVLGWGFLGGSVVLIGVLLAVGATAHRRNEGATGATTR